MSQISHVDIQSPPSDPRDQWVPRRTSIERIVPLSIVIAMLKSKYKEEIVKVINRKTLYILENSRGSK